MWVFTRSSFLSLVSDPNDPDMLTVRARHRGDIEKLFPAYTASMTPGRDYRYRCVIPRQEVTQALLSEVSKVIYSNFKDSIPNAKRAHWYCWVWRATAEHCPERA